MNDDLTGQSFGRWLVASAAGKDRFRNICWLCECECGSMAVVRGIYLKDGRSLSCGCLKDEKTRERSYKHGHTRKKPTPEYGAWLGMKHRCYCKSNPAYHHYGGRGISVCDRWINSFSNFVDDMGLKPSISHSIDRVNVNGNYEPSNCRWATKTEQVNNRRTSLFITVGWYTKTQSEWAKMLGINASKIQHKAKSVGHSNAVAYYFNQVTVCE